MTTHHVSVDIPDTVTQTPLSLQEQYSLLQTHRRQIVARYRPIIQQGPGPIRVMARLVKELEQQCREYHFDEEVIRLGIVNRTIGDVDLRRITECEGEEGGPGDYRVLADELGVALPGEQIHGYTATGETYLWLREQMMACERELLKQHIDVRIYDIFGVGNSILRGWLAEEMRQWSIAVTKEQVFLGLGAMDCTNKVLQGLANYFYEQGICSPAVLFPEPGFAVPEWQARTFGMRLVHFLTEATHSFKLTGEQLQTLLEQSPDINLIYLTVTNNPTTFGYNADELNELFTVLRRSWESGQMLYILADLAYIGTADPDEDRLRMAAFAAPDVFQHTIFLSSFSKTHTLTGERFGWVTVGDPQLATAIMPGWTNSCASLPGEWQLRYMAYYRLIKERPWLAEKLRAFYRLRRHRLVAQLERLNSEQRLFEQIYLGDDATVYNWSQLSRGEDAFSLFEKTGIAGVPGSGFGYSDDYIRFSIGVIPV